MHCFPLREGRLGVRHCAACAGDCPMRAPLLGCRGLPYVRTALGLQGPGLYARAGCLMCGACVASIGAGGRPIEEDRAVKAVGTQPQKEGMAQSVLEGSASPASPLES